MSGRDLSYFSVQRQGRKHLNTLLKKERYDFTQEDVGSISPRMLEEEGLLYQMDGETGAVQGDVETKDTSAVDNAAAFLEGEFSDEKIIWAYGLESGGESQGAVAAYTDTQDPNVLRDQGRNYLIPSSFVHVFEPVKGSDQSDIYIERHGSGDITRRQG